MDAYRNVRNVAIIVAIGLGVYFIPGGGAGARGVGAALWVAFAVAIALTGLRAYRENQLRLAALGDRHRGLLYGAVALGVFCYASYHRMTGTDFGKLVWFVLVAAALWGLMEVYRHARSY